MTALGAPMRTTGDGGIAREGTWASVTDETSVTAAITMEAFLSLSGRQRAHPPEHGLERWIRPGPEGGDRARPAGGGRAVSRARGEVGAERHPLHQRACLRHLVEERAAERRESVEREI